MTHLNPPFFPPFVTLATAIAILSVGANRAQQNSKPVDVATSRTQSQQTDKKADTGKPSDPTGDLPSRNSDIPSETPRPSSEFVLAVGQNVRLSRELKWFFGGKEQQGWYLYTSLIKRLLGTSAEPFSEPFAAALSSWQSKSGLPPSGVLDEASLAAMVSLWQGQRIKDRAFPPLEQLITAPASDFHDPTRPPDRRQVEREAYAAYKRMVAAAITDKSLGLDVDTSGELATGEKFLKLISAYRSREYQELLRRQTPNAGRAGLAVNSPHFTGRALDLYVGGDPVETIDSNRAIQVQTAVYQWLVNNAERFGFRPYYYEPWHWEYVKPVTDYPVK